jgi:hypothetical protein
VGCGEEKFFPLFTFHEVLVMTDNTGNILRDTLKSYGAREFEIVALSGDPHRGLAAIQQAVSKRAERPIPYATALYDNREWSPKGETRRVATNQHVERACEHCGGDRIVFVTADPSQLYGETVAPCEKCNASANTIFYRVSGQRMEAKPA